MMWTSQEMKERHFSNLGALAGASPADALNYVIDINIEVPIFISIIWIDIHDYSVIYILS